MTELNGGQIAALQLRAAGIDTVFGVVAGPMIEVFAGAQEAGLKVVNCRHEENAGFMASAWGYVKGKPGVVIAGSGPGMTNTVTPMHVATASAMPLVVLGGSTYARHRGIGGFQECDQMAFAAPGCKQTFQVDSTERIAELVYLALGKSVTGRPGAVYVDFPGNFVANRVEEQRARLRERSPEVTRPHPDPNAIERAADMLAQAKSPLVIVGKGAGWADAGASLTRLVNLGIPYICSPMARGVIDDDNPNFMNGARGTALRGADAIVMIGGRFNWIFSMGRASRLHPEVRLAQIDIEAEEMFNGSNLELGIVADAAVAAEQLADALANRTLNAAAGKWTAALRAKSEENALASEAVMASEASPIDPHRLVREVRDVLPRNASIAVDGEVIMGICRTLLPSFGARSRLNAGTTGCMGTGAPYAIGAALADPDRPSVAVLGDYAFGAAAMSIETAMRVGAKAVFVVSNNEGIAGHGIQDRMMPPNSPKIASLLPASYEKMAEMVDGHAERVEAPEDIRPALERALASDRVSLVHVRTDPKASRIGGASYLG